MGNIICDLLQAIDILLVQVPHSFEYTGAGSGEFYSEKDPIAGPMTKAIKQMSKIITTATQPQARVEVAKLCITAFAALRAAITTLATIRIPRTVALAASYNNSLGNLLDCLCV